MRLRITAAPTRLHWLSLAQIKPRCNTQTRGSDFASGCLSLYFDKVLATSDKSAGLSA
jgi:hypothetical protein